MRTLWIAQHIQFYLNYYNNGTIIRFVMQIPNIIFIILKQL